MESKWAARGFRTCMFQYILYPFAAVFKWKKNPPNLHFPADCELWFDLRYLNLLFMKAFMHVKFRKMWDLCTRAMKGMNLLKMTAENVRDGKFIELYFKENLLEICRIFRNFIDFRQYYTKTKFASVGRGK